MRPNQLEPGSQLLKAGVEIVVNNRFMPVFLQHTRSMAANITRTANHQNFQGLSPAELARKLYNSPAVLFSNFFGRATE
jgi:hypothetical protein